MDGDGQFAIQLTNVESPKYEPSPPESPRQIVTRLLVHPGLLGEFLERRAPDEKLAALLAAVDVDEVDDYSLVEVTAAYKRLEAWSAAQAARAAAALADRDSVNPTWPGDVPGRTRGECVVGQELAIRLRVSKLTATRMVAAGRGFSRLFRPTGEALEQGLIDFPRALAIVTTLEKLPSDVAMAAQLEVLAKAPGRTLRQVHGDLAKAVIAVDPDGADARHRAAREERKVNRPRPLPDGMALVSAVLPAGDAIALDTALEAAARAAKAAGDKRTLDQLRADSLALMGHAALALGFIGAHPTQGCRCGCTAPGAPPTPATQTGTAGSLDGAGAAFGISSPTSHSSCAAAPPHPGRRLQGEALPTIRLGMLGGGRSDIRITIPLHVLLPGTRKPDVGTAMDTHPEPVAELEGYGPVPPVIARALAEGGTWRRLVTEPLGDQVLDVGRTRYQPPAPMADHVRERDRTCVRPGCSTPARGCDLDHIHEWQHGGVTSAQNLGPLCKTDHPIKGIGAFTVAYGSDRTYAWTTPT
ncbi:MAG TPA: DUF222 domain-containing protein, partial [Actinomycetaceae bacterium]|nr:DUF222 domain-containing protein [Actinomycetaceae bacterium]